LIITLTTRLYLRNVAVGRFVTICIEKGLFAYVNIVEEECGDLPLMETLRKCWLMIVVLSSSFYSLFLFDTFGSSSSQASYWILIVVPGIPCFSFILSKWVAHCWSKRMEGRGVVEHSEKELQPDKGHMMVQVMDVVDNPMKSDAIDHVKDGVELVVSCSTSRDCVEAIDVLQHC